MNIVEHLSKFKAGKTWLENGNTVVEFHNGMRLKITKG